MSELGREQEMLLRALTRHGVEMVVVGGVAAQVHGWRGATADLDIAVSLEDGNVERLNAALASVGAGPGMPGALGTVFTTRYGRLEIVSRADGIGDYAAWLRRARARELGKGLTAVVADPDDLLLSKEAAGRAKDLATLPQMRRDFIETGSLAAEAVRGEVAAGMAPADMPPAFLAKLLGTRPASAGKGRIWDGAAQLVLDFRARWEIKGDADPLGPIGVSVRQDRDRAELERALKRALRLLRRGS